MEVYLVWKSLRDLTLSLSPHIQQLLGEIKNNTGYDQPITLNEIKEREDVYLLDVRPSDEFNQKHILNANSIPIEELNSRLGEIPKDKLIITYCRGMFCFVADEAVKMLHHNGFNAKKIEESVLDYQIKSE